MVESKQKSFLFDTGLSAGAAPKRRFAFYLWNYGLLMLSAAGICLITLQLAIGVYTDEIFFDYFSHPLILLLNFLPILLVMLLAYAATNRAWSAFLITSAVFVTAAIGNFYKLRFRSDPFMFSDLTAIHTAFGVSSEYDLTPGKRIIFSILFVIAGAAFLYFFVRARSSGRTRAVIAVIVAASLFPLWRFLYSSSAVYDEYTQNYDHINKWLTTESFISRGFVYPFIYSSLSAADKAPDGYDAQEAEEILSQYSDSDIPEDKRVNIVAFQLEAFTDFTTLGITGLEEVYADYHALEAESYTGTLVTNVFGGGTVNTERCFITGYSQLKNYRQNVNSYVWYLRQQGYITDGSHPCFRSFYNRLNVNEYLGFESYYFTEGFYERYGSGPALDDALFPEAYNMLTNDLSTGKNVFSFHVSYQGHGPYDTEKLIWGDALWNGDVSDYSYYVINNYLGSVKDTIDRLVRFKTQLEELDEPVVLVVFGDHKPWLGDNSASYKELGINLDQSTTEGFMNYYSTRYLIWANSAAKEIIGDDLVGDGPTISPCYLMNELFSLLGWDGPAYMKFTNSCRDELPVVNSNDFYLDNGEVSTELSDKLSAKKEQFDCVQYYMRRNFYYSEVAS